MVKALHARRHRGRPRRRLQPHVRGWSTGPMVCLRGIDNATYYRLAAGTSRYYVDFTGCGNTLNVQHPQTLKLVTDSLRYWVTEMHVDGFRFDLAPTLARRPRRVDRSSRVLRHHPPRPGALTHQAHRRAWDLGAGGYQAGNFPVLWTEWNGRYRDAVRRFWHGDRNAWRSWAHRLTGSSDLFERRRAYAPRQHQLRHRARRLHASRPRAATSGSTTRRTARTTGMGPTTTRVELRRRGRDRRPPRSRCAIRERRNSSRRSSCPRASRCSRWATSCGARSAETTIPTARTTSSPWVDWELLPRPSGCSPSSAMSYVRKRHPALQRKLLLPRRAA